MSYIQSAFEALLPDAIESESWYVVLTEYTTSYGGPEEGGWFRHDQIVVSFKEFPSEELATAMADRVRELAKELEHQASMEHGEYCLRTMEWLEERGLDADFLPEPDGPSTFNVSVTNEVPQNYYDNTVWG